MPTEQAEGDGNTGPETRESGRESSSFLGPGGGCSEAVFQFLSGLSYSGGRVHISELGSLKHWSHGSPELNLQFGHSGAPMANTPFLLHQKGEVTLPLQMQ